MRTGRTGSSSINAASFHAAPRFTHSRIVFTCASVNCFFGGMCGSASFPSAFTRRLASGLPGTITAPLSPPSSSRSRALSTSPPLCFSPL